MSPVACTKPGPAPRSSAAGDDCTFRVSDDSRDDKWDHFLASAPLGHHTQTSLWSQVKASRGWQATRIVVTRGKEIVAGAQVLYRRLPLLGGIGYVPAGPVVRHADPDLTRLLLDRLLELRRHHGLHYLAVQPPGHDQAVSSQLVTLGFQASSVELIPGASVLIDLTLDPAEMLSRMKRQTRQNIARGERQGMVVREGSRDDVRTFWTLNAATCRRQNASPFPESYFLHMWDVLEPAGCLKLFVAEYEGQAVSALWTVPFGDTVSAKALGWSGLHGDRKPNDVLFWAAINWSRTHGYRWFDFEGVNRSGAECVLQGQPLPESLQRTPDAFKYGFGGNVTLFQLAHEYIPNPVLRWGYRTFFAKDGNTKSLPKLFEIIRKH